MEKFDFAVTEQEATVIDEPGIDTDWDVELVVEGSLVDFKIDTGADTTVVTEAMFSGLQRRPRLTHSRPMLYSLGGKVRCVDKFLANTIYKGQKYRHWITVKICQQPTGKNSGEPYGTCHKSE